MRLPFLLYCFYLPLLTFGQHGVSDKYETEYFGNGEVKTKYKTFQGQKVDTLIAYDIKGRIQSILYFGDYGSTNPYREDYCYTGASRKSTGYYVIKVGTDTVIVGNWKYYWKNGNVMDSVIYDNSGNQKYRARFGKNGMLKVEYTETERKVYNSDGSIRLIKKI